VRKAHYLTHNTRTCAFNHAIYFDVETYERPIGDDARELTLWLGWCAYVRYRDKENRDTVKYHYFETPDSFWSFVLSHAKPKRRLYLIAHNVQFDFVILKSFRYLYDAGYELRSFYTRGTTVLMRFCCGTSTIVVLDSMNYFKSSLERLGKAIGLAKMEVDFDTASDEELSEYCKNDVDILIRAFDIYRKFVIEHDLGNYALTIPSQSFNAFRHRFMKHKILIHDNETALKIERQAYRGGRTQPFRIGEYRGGTFYQLDINSMYPYVMREYEYPIELRYVLYEPSLSEVDQLLLNHCVIAEAYVTTDDDLYVYELNKRNVYPTGSFYTTLTTEELRYAMARGQVDHFGLVAVYKRAPVFRDFVDYFYSLRLYYKERDNRSFDMLCKLILNSLYGKFGQKGINQKRIGDCDLDEFRVEHHIDAESGKNYYVYLIGGNVIQYEEEDESPNSFPAIAAHVTANARLYLYRLMCEAGRDHVYYTDTDSLIVDEAGYDRLKTYLDDTELGMLKIEASGDTLILNAPKDYQLGNKIRMKGIRSDAERIDDTTFVQDQWPSLRGMIRRNETDRYIIKRITKKLHRRVNYGVLLEDGRIRPYRIPDDFIVAGTDDLFAEDIHDEIEALKEACTLPSSVVFRFYSYVNKNPRRVRDKSGELQPWYYSKADEVATEYGYESSDDFIAAIIEQAEIYERIHELRQLL